MNFSPAITEGGVVTLADTLSVVPWPNEGELKNGAKEDVEENKLSTDLLTRLHSHL